MCPDCQVSPILKENLKRFSEHLIANTSDKNLQAEARALTENIDNLNFCTIQQPSPKANGKKQDKPEKKRTPRQEFMSYCMRGPAKEGLGLPMADCAKDWKGKSAEEQAKFASS